jgi:3-deoxy-manno-octulosonate cytidylyltransferase (CMP-KDO synthetase)
LRFFFFRAPFVVAASAGAGWAQMGAVAIIPARFGSTRFPGKPLALIGGKPMIQHVYENTAKTPGLDRVVVATDDRRILEAVRAFGGEAVLTSRRHGSGTERLAEAARRFRAGWVINVQGDLPFVRPRTIQRSLAPLLRDPQLPMGTAKTRIRSEAEWRDPNVVKVVTDARGFALYFSRAPIPYSRERPRASRDGAAWGYRHIGIYVYRRDFLLRFARLTPTWIERVEALEQLRALAHGYRIRVVEVDDPAVEVNVPQDLQRAERFLRLNGLES